MSTAMKTTIILIGGPSAVGKDHFIGELERESSLRSMLGIFGPFQSMTAPEGQDVKRMLISELARILKAPPDVLILKWQAFFRRKYIDSLLWQYPHIRFRGVFLKLVPDQHAERMYQKHSVRYGFPDMAAALAECKRQAKNDLSNFKKLRVPITYIDADSQEIIDGD
jgi:hypothetical protein